MPVLSAERMPGSALRLGTGSHLYAIGRSGDRCGAIKLHRSSEREVVPACTGDPKRATVHDTLPAGPAHVALLRVFNPLEQPRPHVRAHEHGQPKDTNPTNRA